jgi:hypothetical protein
MKLCISNSHLSEHTHKSNLRINSNIVTLSSQQVEFQSGVAYCRTHIGKSDILICFKKNKREREKKEKKKKKEKEKEKNRNNK